MIALLACALLGLSVGGAPAHQESAAPEAPLDARRIELHRAADAALRKGRWSDPHAAFLAAFEADPKNPTLAYGVACGLLRQGGSADGAIEWLERAVGLGYRDAAVAHWDYHLAAVRRHERFLELFPKSAPTEDMRLGWPLAGSRRGELAAAPDGKWVAYAPAGGGVEIVDVESGELRYRIGETRAPAVALAVDAEGAVLATLHGDGVLVLWSVPTGEPVATSDAAKRHPADSVPVLTYAAGGDRIVARVGRDVILWTSMGEHVATVRSEDPRAWQGFAACSAGDQWSEARGRDVHLYDARTGKKDPEPLHFDQRVTGVRMAPDGLSMAVGTELAMVVLVDLDSRETRWRGAVPDTWKASGVDPMGNPLWVPTLRFDPAGQRLAVCTASAFNVGVFDVATGERIWRTSHLGGRMGLPMPLAVGAHVLVGDGGLCVWTSKTGEKRGRWPVDLGHTRAAVGGSFLVQLKRGFAVVNGETFEVVTRYEEPPRFAHIHPSGWGAGDLPADAFDVDPMRFDPKRLRAARQGVPLFSPSGR